MDSSLIFLTVVGLWAAYLVPHWLRRREQLSACRSVDRFSAAMRVLARRAEPAAGAPGTGTGVAVRRPLLLTSPVLSGPGAQGVRVRGAASTSGVRVVPGRQLRRRTAGGRALLLTSVLAAVALGSLAWFSLVPPWALAAGAGQLVGVLLVLRLRARRLQARRLELARSRALLLARASRVPAPRAAVEGVEPDDVEVREPVAALRPA